MTPSASGKGSGGAASTGSGKGPESVAGAVARLHAARDQAKQRRAAARRAVEQLRERNREESRRLAERGRHGRRHQQWPGHSGPQGQPRELRLYDTDDPDAPPAGLPEQPDVPRRASDDDWSRETWMH